LPPLNAITLSCHCATAPSVAMLMLFAAIVDAAAADLFSPLYFSRRHFRRCRRH